MIEVGDAVEQGTSPGSEKKGGFALIALQRTVKQMAVSALIVFFVYFIYFLIVYLGPPLIEIGNNISSLYASSKVGFGTTIVFVIFFGINWLYLKYPPKSSYGWVENNGLTPDAARVNALYEDGSIVWNKPPSSLNWSVNAENPIKEWMKKTNR